MKMAELNKKILSDDELDGVYGGQGGCGRNCVVTGPYWDTPAGEGSGKTDLISKPKVTAKFVSYAQGRCKYQLFQNGQEKGWTVQSNITYY